MLRMNSVRKKRTDKTVVKEHIVLAAAKSFAQKGVKTVRMDDIAAGLSISKRTLYELFHDKEDLLLDVMKLHREEMQEYMTQVASKAENVLEVLLNLQSATRRQASSHAGSTLVFTSTPTLLNAFSRSTTKV